MSERKRLREGVKETVDEAARLIDKGADKAGELIDRGMRKVEEGARQAGGPAPKDQHGPGHSAGEVVDDAAVFIGRTGKKALDAADKGLRKVGQAVERDPDLKHVIDKGVGAVDKVVEKGIEIAKKGIRKTEEIIEKERKRR